MQVKTICFFGIYKSAYSRNRVLMKGFRANGLEVIECNSQLFGFKKYVDLIKKYRRIHNKFDVMLVAFPGYQAMILAKFLTRKPIIFDAFCSLYNMAVEDRKTLKKKSLKANYYKFLDWLSCILADKVLLDTEANINYFVKNFRLKKNKFIRVFVGTDSDLFYPIRPSEAENAERLFNRVNSCQVAKDDQFLVHFHGHFIPLHGVETIITAINILKNENMVFQIIGKGQDYPQARRMAEEWGLKNIVWIDSVEYEELPEYINKADLCLGGFGDTEKSKIVSMNKLFEYMACGKPIINGDSESVREFLEDGVTVVFCRRADGADLADKILKLKNNPVLRSELGRTARQKFQEFYTPAIIAADLLKDLKLKIL